MVVVAISVLSEISECSVDKLGEVAFRRSNTRRQLIIIDVAALKEKVTWPHFIWGYKGLAIPSPLHI